MGALFVSALCLCAVGAANASAAANVENHVCDPFEGTATAGECNGGGSRWLLVGGNVAVSVTSGGTSTLAVTVAGVKFKISCTGQSGTAVINNSGGKGVGSNITTTYEGCSVTEPSGKGCSVPASISTETLKSESNEMNIKYMPASGETFAVITVSGCSNTALNGKKSLTGSAQSVVEAGTPELQQWTSSSGSALKFAGQSATFISANSLHTTVGEIKVGALTP
jgi:hypothetical protein